MTATLGEATPAPVTMAHLVKSEIRKAYDTRATAILLATLLIAPAAVLVTARASAGPHGRSVLEYLDMALAVVNLLLPMVAALVVTSEWGQRTASSTFLVEPRRGRVLIAKGWVVCLLAVLFITLDVAASVAMTYGGGGEPTHFPLAGVATRYLLQILWAGQGFAFALLLRNTPSAICINLFIPWLFTFLTASLRLGGVGAWINPLMAQSKLMESGAQSSDWLRLGTAEALWVILPAAIGCWFILHREITE